MKKTTKNKKPTDHLLLKWGTLKGWHFEGKKANKLLDEYFKIGSSMSAIMQHDTPRQTEIILKLIDLCNGTICNDLTGRTMNKERAKKYIINYNKN